ncbi:MAG TPA: hypothetical protein VMD98_08850 [Bryocella sp.]|nr:hypothetical protein [Bryocella sp.]
MLNNTGDATGEELEYPAGDELAPLLGEADELSVPVEEEDELLELVEGEDELLGLLEEEDELLEPLEEEDEPPELLCAHVAQAPNNSAIITIVSSCRFIASSQPPDRSRRPGIPKCAQPLRESGRWN